MLNRSKMFFLLAAVVCLPLHLFLMITCLDPETSFLVGEGALSFAFGAFLAAGLVGILLSALVRLEDTSFALRRPRLLGVLGLLLGAGCLVQGVLAPFSGDFALSYDGQLNPGGLLMMAAMVAFSLLGGAAFLQQSGRFLTQGSDPAPGGVLLAAPTFWALAWAIQVFLYWPNLTQIPSRCLLLLTLLSVAIFLLGHGRLLCRRSRPRDVRWVCGFGLCAGLCGALLCAGEVVAWLRGGPSLSPLELVCAAEASAYAAVFAWGTAPLKGSRSE